VKTVGRLLRAFGLFWWDFLVGDTPELARAGLPPGREPGGGSHRVALGGRRVPPGQYVPGAQAGDRSLTGRGANQAAAQAMADSSRDVSKHSTSPGIMKRNMLMAWRSHDSSVTTAQRFHLESSWWNSSLT
jgi:hypothetical protein